MIVAVRLIEELVCMRSLLVLILVVLVLVLVLIAWIDPSTGDDAR